jgi:hypothetical protein
MLTPLKWLVQSIAWLPDVVRPGIFVASIVLIVWFAAVQRGLPDLWHALCRGAARVLHFLVGVALLPDYWLTTARQRRGEPPSEAVMTIGEVAERVLDGTQSFYERNQREPIEWKPFPWIVCVTIVAVLAIPWVVMDKAPVDSETRRQLANVFDRWRDVEDWADVDPSRRAAPGISWSPRPRAKSMRRHGRTVGVTLHCPAGERCRGRIILRTPAGRRLRTREASVKAKATKTVHLHLSRAQASRPRLQVRIARAAPR